MTDDAVVEETLSVIGERVVAAPVDAVWAAFVEPELVQRWWGPTGFTCPVARMDVRAGGVSLVAMRAPAEYGGGDLWNTWTYSAVEPQARLEYEMRFADAEGATISPGDAGIPPGVPDAVPHVVTFTAADGGTLLRITESGYTDETARAMSQAGLDQCLDKLEAALA